MMFLQGLSGPTAQLLGTSPVYKCNLTICYGADGSGATHALFKALQASLNRFASVGAFSPIVVDGFIGAGTVTAAQRTAAYLMKQYAGQPAVATLGALSQTRDTVARGAQVLQDTLKFYADTGGLTAPPMPPPGPPGQQLPPPAPGDTTFPGIPPAPPGQSNAWKWALGIGLVAVAGFVYYQSTKDEEPASSSM